MNNPIFDFIEEGMPVEWIYKNMGFEIVSQLGIDWLEEEEMTEIYENDPYGWLESWNPSPAEGYYLVAKFDSEDGPVAIFVKPLTELARVQLAWGFSSEAQNAAMMDSQQKTEAWEEYVRSRLAGQGEEVRP